MSNSIALQPKQPIKIAIGNIVSEGAHPLIVRNVETVVTDNIGQHAELDVVSYKEIVSMLNLEEQKQLAGCKSDASCLAEIGGAMGVDKLITGSVGFLGESYIISLQLIDIHKGQVESRAQVRVKQGEEKEFLVATDQAARQLIAPILWQEPSTPWRTFQILKWSSLAMALGSFGLGIGMATRSQSEKKNYDILISDLVDTGNILPASQNYKFRNNAAKLTYKPQLDALQKNSKDAAFLANVGFVAGGLSLVAAGAFFYLDRSSPKADAEPLTGWNFSVGKNEAFGSLTFSF